MIVYNFTNSKQQRLRLIVTVEAIFDLRIRTRNLFQKYLQSKSHLICNIYFISRKFGLKFKIQTPLNSLHQVAKVDDYYHQTKTNCVNLKLKMQLSGYYLEAFAKVQNLRATESN